MTALGTPDELAAQLAAGTGYRLDDVQLALAVLAGAGADVERAELLVRDARRRKFRSARAAAEAWVIASRERIPPTLPPS